MQCEKYGSGFRRAASFFVALALAFAVFAPAFCVSTAGADGKTGNISLCEYDAQTESVRISGTIAHGVLPSYTGAKLAVYRVMPWESAEDVIARGEPAASCDLGVRFDFSVPASGAADKLAAYVVVIESGGEKIAVDTPRHIDLASASTLPAGFKGIAADESGETANVAAGAVFVNVYLDRLFCESSNGYFFNSDGMIYYFDRDETDSLDRAVRSAYASGANVYLRFLVSADTSAEGFAVPFASTSVGAAQYRALDVSTEEGALALYALTYFIVSRYGDGSSGKISGIVLGRSADVPWRYGYSDAEGDAYFESYARALVLVGLTAVMASDRAPALVVPVSDATTDDGAAHCRAFLSSVAERVYSFSKLTFFVMVDSENTPYGLSDEFFLTSSESGDDASDAALPVDVGTSETGGEEDAPPEVDGGETPSYTPPEKNDVKNGFFCTDTLDVFIEALSAVRSRCLSVNAGYIWCWHTGSVACEEALSASYLYCCAALSAGGASTFVTDIEATSVSGGFLQTIRYAGTDKTGAAEARALAVFAAEDWGDIISGYTGFAGSGRELRETALLGTPGTVAGSVPIWNFKAKNGVLGWFADYGCNSLKSDVDGSDRYLSARMSGSRTSSVGIVCKEPELAAYSDSISFELECVSNDSRVFEICVSLVSGDLVTVASAMVDSNARQTLYLAIDASSAAEITSARISVTDGIGDEPYELRVYEISLNSAVYDDAQLSYLLSEARADKRTDEGADALRDAGGKLAVIAAFALTAAVLAAVFVADRHRAAKKGENRSPGARATGSEAQRKP